MKPTLISRYIDVENTFKPLKKEDFRDAIIQYEISRSEIENQITSRLIHDLRCAADNPMTFSDPGRIIFTVSGYDGDPREIYQIPEIQQFLRRANDFNPCWIYFALPESCWLQIVAYCVLRSASANRACPDKNTLAFSAVELAQFLESQIDSFYELCDNADADQGKVEAHLRDALCIFGIKLS